MRMLPTMPTSATSKDNTHSRTSQPYTNTILIRENHTQKVFFMLRPLKVPHPPPRLPSSIFTLLHFYIFFTFSVPFSDWAYSYMLKDRVLFISYEYLYITYVPTRDKGSLWYQPVYMYTAFRKGILKGSVIWLQINVLKLRELGH